MIDRDEYLTDGAREFETLWRQEENLLRSLIDNVRQLRADISGEAVPAGDTEPHATPFSDPRIEMDEPADVPAPGSDEPAVDTGAEDAFPEETDIKPEWRDEIGPETQPNMAPCEATSETDEPFAYGDEPPIDVDASTEDPVPDEPVADAQSESADEQSRTIATLAAMDEETGDCFTYEIVDHHGEPAEHPDYELVGHEIRLRPGAVPGQSGIGLETIRMKMTNAAGDERFVEYVPAVEDAVADGAEDPFDAVATG